MLKTFFAECALERTRPHPADKAVRLTASADDLIALHCKDIKAVIWERDMPNNLVQVLANLDPASIEGRRKIRLPSPESQEFDKAIIDQGCLKVLAEINHDTISLTDIFCKAGNTSRILNPLLEHSPFDLINYTTIQEIGPVRSVAEPMTDTIFHPHFDGYATRLLTTYSPDPELGMVWYPGQLRKNALDAFQTRIASANTLDEIKGIQDEYGAQHMRAGHVIHFKGKMYPGEEGLLHGSPVPKQNVVRLLYMNQILRI